ncbi:UDP-4-amino-4,6-dideoxy-N-acetyl-beta-L-altrosamine transaminase [Alkalibacillus aidingensis]|uniref:UDP-4-amino-4, 6-dideoxy-N-acetyl-beta-L-altrosamine transaminase n=1 Tax=Alkalibacillus aidingensis TaxID=2747607 RepID=UPI0016604367|nr:UDP-4-amino-4,6-dideoxy-N-acetyl-beta-L-altrosamine transaminase [Alkalibacillus aidingensis]
MKKLSKLAIHGGQPVRKTFLPYGKQWVSDDDVEAVVETLTSDFLTTGPKIDQFEEELAKYVGAKYGVAFANGTAALHAACFAAGVGEGDEVITTPMTFAATANSILYQRATPVFSDTNPDTWNMDLQKVRSLITDQTKAILPVDYMGNPCNYQELLKIAQDHDLTIIEDAAHALGATDHGRKVGSISDLTMFSFHPVKQITTGEGGIVTTNRQDYYEKLIQFRTHGMTRDSSKLLENHGPWYYEMQFLGFNYRMTDLQAALGISQLKKLDSFIQRRKQIAKKYHEAFQLLSPIQTSNLPNGCDSSWHLYVIRLKLEELTTDRKTIFTALQHENIGVNVHYIPVYYQPYYQHLGYKKGICPNVEQLYEEIITLPLFPAMSNEDVENVITAIQKVIEHYAK